MQGGGKMKRPTSMREPLLEHHQEKAASSAATVIAIGDAEQEQLLVHGGGEGKGKEGQQSVCTAAVVLSTTVAVCASFAKGVCMGFTAPTQSAIVADLHLSLSQFSFFGSILNIGAILGSTTSGKVADVIGRKGAFRLSAVFCILGWFLIYFASDASLLNIGRFVTGYGIAIFSYVVPVFIAEIAPRNLRGSFASLNQVLVCTGGAYSYVVGTVVSWRTLAFTATIPCLLLLVGLFFVPESPRWMAKAGRDEEFKEALQTLRGKDADISQEFEDIQEYIKNIERLPKPTLCDLIQRKYLHSITICVGLMAFQQLGGFSGIIYYTSQIFESAGFPSGNFGLIVTAIIQVPISVFAATLMDKAGRRRLLLISVSGLFVGTLLIGVAFYWKASGILLEWDPILTLTGILVFTAFYSTGMGAIPWILMSEIFPMDIKGTAGSLAVLEHWFGAWILSYSFNFLASWSASGTFFIFATINAMALVFVKVLVPETKGRTLEEIQTSMTAS